MMPALDISTSALVAQRTRMNVISQNIANIGATRNERGEPSPPQPKFVIFQTDDTVGAHGAMGVKVSSVEADTSEPRLRWEPNHPDAIKEGPNAGKVAYPNTDMMVEFTDALEAARSYEANLGAMEITKDLEHQTLRILA